MAKETKITEETAINGAARVAIPAMPVADKFVEDVIDELVRLSVDREEKTDIS